MKNIRIILALMLACLANSSHAQRDRAFIPPDMGETITYTFSALELQGRNAFIDSLNVILFDKKCSASDFYPEDKSWRNFYLLFVKKDSLNYSIRLSFKYHPGRNSWGFFERDGYRYFLYGDIPPPILY